MDNFSAVFAGRLKSLRQERGLSLKTLADELNSQYAYEILSGNRAGKKQTISEAALKAYEAGENHSRSGDNKGMRAEYLLWLADFYEVSTDYLLGRTDIRSPHMNVQAIAEETGLSEKSVHDLMGTYLGGTKLLSPIVDDILSLGDSTIICDYLLLKKTADGFTNLSNPANEQEYVKYHSAVAKLSEYGDTSISKSDFMRFLSAEIGRVITEGLRKLYIPEYGKEK